MHIVKIDAGDIRVARAIENQRMRSGDGAVETQKAVWILVDSGHHSEIVLKDQRHVDVNPLAFSRPNGRRYTAAETLDKGEAISAESQTATAVTEDELVQPKTFFQVVLDLAAAALVEIHHVVRLAMHFRPRSARPPSRLAPGAVAGITPGESV